MFFQLIVLIEHVLIKDTLLWSETVSDVRESRMVIHPEYEV